ncbi:MAG: hypothetical protein M1825_004871 [Sarcosagium campestre]|nr:MAG: hypothetical protein M1825_004871 [Sarcosagium campestre]
MSATSASPPQGSPSNLAGALDQGNFKGQSQKGSSLQSFLASLAVAALIFTVEFILFIIIKGRFSRIYQPRTFLVPEKERTKAPPQGFLSWLLPVFKTSNSDFIQKCGLDAYFFLRYLRTLLKIFVPLAFVILPALLPLNKIGGKGTQNGYNVTGLDQLSWGNVSPSKTNRYWAHLLLAILVVAYTCFIFFDELRGYIRLRQAYLTSPQHRLRASATTVLVTAIPRKWLSVEALEGLYDVFPGGIRNIWINRNFDDLSDKVKLRDKYALELESAETELIKKAKKAQMKRAEAEAKRSGQRKSKAERKKQIEMDDARGAQMAQSGGTAAGNPHQVRHTLREAIKDQDDSPSEHSPTREGGNSSIPILGAGLETVGHGFERLGQNVLGGLRKAGKGFDERLNPAQGLVLDESPPSLPAKDDLVGDGVGPGYRAKVGGAAGESDVHPAYRAAHGDFSGPPNDTQASPTNTLSPTGQSGTGVVAADSHTTPLDPRAQIDGANDSIEEGKLQPGWKFWSKGRRNSRYAIPSPQPKTKDRQDGYFKDANPKNQTEDADSTTEDGMPYPTAFEERFDNDKGRDPVWKKYLKPSDRETMRIPIFKPTWCPSLPLIGKKVDKIYYCRRELARLNVEIERDQKRPEDFPLMNSAFIQFNHQVAAHMACQAVSHHIPKQMGPRLVEIAPDDVLWDNMSLKWWERYVRGSIVTLVIGALVVGWAFPVAFTGLLSQLGYLTALLPWLAWINKLPASVIGLIQGVLPPALLALLMILLPIILRSLASLAGALTGMSVELAVQNSYFAFVFVQITLIVSISSGITKTIQGILDNPSTIPQVLATSLPGASNYFFSYMILQAFSVSAGALVQIGGLFNWFIVAPIFDNTARKKWERSVNLPTVKWGTFFPIYTNLACIGLIYSVISPFIMVFNIITFSLFWVVYRYNTLYVTRFRFDTKGLLFPRAINQLFTGLYVMELALIGLFFLVRDSDGKAACSPQAIIMIVVAILTIIFQYLLNEAFGPLFNYLPITLEDDAVERDAEFSRAQFTRLNQDEKDGDDLQDVLAERERRERQEDREAEEYELQQIEARRKSRLDPRSHLPATRASWVERSKRRKTSDFGHYSASAQRKNTSSNNVEHAFDKDVETQGRDHRIGDAFFQGIPDTIEDLSPEQRDTLVQKAFQHQALRAKRPAIWIPRDDLGVCDDEIFGMNKFSKHIWISNEHAALDGAGRAVYWRSPPDFSEIDVIEL